MHKSQQGLDDNIPTDARGKDSPQRTWVYKRTDIRQLNSHTKSQSASIIDKLSIITNQYMCCICTTKYGMENYGEEIRNNMRKEDLTSWIQYHLLNPRPF